MNKALQKERVPWLDALRFISAILVVIAHCRANFFAIYSNLIPESQTITTKVFYFFASFSDDAVFVFFLLSGFLVGGKLLNNIIHHQNVDWLVFVIQRFTRILLPLFASLIVCILVYYLEGLTPSWIRIVGNALSLQGAFVESEGGVLWTMPYIVWSYVFLLSITMLCSHSRKVQICGIILFGTTIVLFLVFPHQKCFLCVALGAFAFFIRRLNLSRGFLLLSIIIIAATAITAKFAKPSMSRDTSMLSFVNLDIINLLECFFMAILLSQIVKIKPKNLTLKNIEIKSSKLSVFSYSLYLSHFQAIKLMIILGFPQSRIINISSMGLFFIEIMLCVLFGYIFYLLFERPTESLRKRLMLISFNKT